MKTQLTDIAKGVCEANGITTDEDLNKLIKEIKTTMRLEHEIKAKEYNKMSPSEIIEWQVEQRRNNPITGQ